MAENRPDDQRGGRRRTEQSPTSVERAECSAGQTHGWHSGSERTRHEAQEAEAPPSLGNQQETRS